MTDLPRPDESARRYFRRLAKSVKSAGDSVGPNDMALSNRLWQVAADLRVFADRFGPRDDVPPRLHPGDLVQVTFDNAVLIAYDEGTGKAAVGSPRFYGRGWFDADQVVAREPH